MYDTLRRLPPATFFAAFWLAGLASAQAGQLLTGLGLTLAAVSFMFSRNLRVHSASALAALLAASARIYLSSTEGDALNPSVLAPTVVTVVGTVEREPQVTNGVQSFILDAETIATAQGIRHVSQKVAVRYPGYQDLSRGSRVSLQGSVRLASDPSTSNYGRWLEAHGIRYTLWAYSATVRGFSNWDPLGPLRKALRQNLLNALPDPEAGVALGLVLGDTSRLGQDMRSTFASTGTAHILAVSGWNVTLVAGAILATAVPILGRRWAAVVALIGIVAFIALIGPEPSVLRAGLMGSVSALSMAMYRGYSSLTALAIAAVSITLADPTMLKDLGFQLSFLATLGIITVHAGRRTDQTLGPMGEALGMTLAAQLFVSPLLAYTFGQISLVAPLANLALVPILPLSVLLSAATAAAGLIHQGTAEVVGWVAWLPITAMLRILEALAGLPMASLSIEIPWPAVILFYLLVAAFALSLPRHRLAALYVSGILAGLPMGLTWLSAR